MRLDKLSKNAQFLVTIGTLSLFLLGCPGQPGPMVEVPDVVGEPQAGAEAAITDAGLVVGAITEEHSAEIAEGNVISSSPEANTEVDEGSSVDLVISLGPAEEVEVPDVVGEPQADAEAAITDAGLVVGAIIEEHSAEIAEGNVISSSPEANTEVDEGSSVDLVISLGPAKLEEVRVPLVVNQELAVAENAIEDRGLVVGTVTERRSGQVAPGDILEQDPAFGEMVERGTAVDLVVAKGPDAHINTIERLQEIGTEDYPSDGFYVLGGDIDATATANWNNGLGFKPLRKFEGVLDGQDHVITGLTIERTSAENVGLFGVIGEDGVIKNVGLEDSAVTGERSVGALAGANFGSIEESYANGAVAGRRFIGGLAGSNNGLITRSSSRSVVEGGSAAGGLVGDQVDGTISESYALGTVSAEREVAGGLLGWNDAGEVSNAYATGAVDGDSQIGGLVGRNEGGEVSKSYATGAVDGEFQIGGLLGSNDGGSVEASFWNTGTSGLDISAGGIGRTTGQMRSRFTYTEVAPPWDFTNVWDIDEGQSYPYLREAEGGDVLVPDVVGMAQDEAQQTIEAAGLRVGEVTLEYDEDVPEDEVIAQAPAPETEVVLPAEVDIVVSLGPEPEEDADPEDDAGPEDE